MTEEEIILKKYYNIGVAVAREVGLIVPIVKNVDKKSIIDIALEINDLGERARQEKLSLDEVQGGTFTITNAGMFGATASTPIISQPQVAILGVHLIQKKPVVHNDEVVIRDMMTFGLSFDHRLIDGHTAVQFLHQVIQYLEKPTSLLLRLR
jgi:pyruvate/2-oxoglutarate dehydrogenase complex dihydrolipoamide acyltransferase (E2) component